MADRRIDLAHARILICNDDGVESPGIKLLARIARGVARDVWVVAPEVEQSGASHSLTLHRPLRIRKLGPRRFAVDGTPTDAVLLAINQILKDRRPDLVLSGINAGGNVGEDVTYSGTIAAALAPRVIRRLAGLPWPRDTLFNVNFPDCLPSQVRGIVAAAQGGRKIGDHLFERLDPRGRPYYWIGPQRDEARSRVGSDVRALAESKVAVTPIFLDLTNRRALAKLKRALA